MTTSGCPQCLLKVCGLSPTMETLLSASWPNEHEVKNMRNEGKMPHEGFTAAHRRLGRSASFVVYSLVVVYTVTMILGFLSLKSPLDQIGDPYFTLMEILMLLMVPPMIISMIAVHAYANQDAKPYSSVALVF